MEAASTSHASTNSKVIVQCTDPYGIFDKFEPLLESRLPLRTLHWKSPTRPLRSIDELDVSLVREDTNSSDGVARRHQMPGLRQTPFLKVLLVRCDDKEIYKLNVRKDAKDWVKSLGVSTTGKPTSKGQERHDAFEYIIVHVVLPDTTAASQPKSSKHISFNETESTDSVNSTNKSKWTGKSTSTIYDRLRADFHSSSKAPFERVAQVRIIDPLKPNTVLTPMEVEDQWEDLLYKLKTAILQSFDTRVAQYEEDIREREAQRQLPGWNFCTFFILKEGLARGFENVGLLEDALSVYEELDTGLDILIENQGKNGEADAMNSLLPYSADLKTTIRTALDGKVNGYAGEMRSNMPTLQQWLLLDEHNMPLKIERRNYQQMILTNQVCALDFRIYIFIRQIQVLLRRAVVPDSSKSGKRKHEIRYDANMLANICERSIKFVSLAARNLRQDLYAAWGGSDALPEHEQHDQKIVIDNIVASWKWSSYLQTLSDCQIAKTLIEALQNTSPDAQLNEMISPKTLTQNDDGSRDRSSSIASASTDASTPTISQLKVSASSIFAANRHIRGQQQNWVLWAGELFMSLRNTITSLPAAKETIRRFQQTAPTANSHATSPDEPGEVATSPGLLAPSLRNIVQNDESTLKAYRLLSAYACQCYTAAGKSRVARPLLLSLARLELNSGDYAAAASWLDAVPGLLDDIPRTQIDSALLDLYADCLSRLDRPYERVRCLMLCLQSVSRHKNAKTLQTMFDEMISTSSQLDGIEAALDVLFKLDQIDSCITHDRDTHGFMISLSLSTSLPIILPNVKAALRLKAKDTVPPTSIDMTYEGPLLFEDGKAKCTLRAHVIAQAWFDLESFDLIIGNLVLKQELRSTGFIEDEEGFRMPSKSSSSSVYVYPHSHAPMLEISNSKTIDLPGRRILILSIDWQEMGVVKVLLKLKPATAGFRLDLQSTKNHSESGETAFTIHRINDAQVLELLSIPSSSETLLEIPYSLDSGLASQVSILAEMKYTIGEQEFESYHNPSINTMLPVSVNVQDVFQSDSNFCRFTVVPSTVVPILLHKCAVEGNADHEIKHGQMWDRPLEVFPRHPAGWVVQVTPKVDMVDSANRSLNLSVHYSCVDEMTLQTVVQAFTSALRQSNFQAYSRPILSHLKTRLLSLWAAKDYELMTLTKEIIVPTYVSMDWPSVLVTLNPLQRVNLAQLLFKWHGDNATLGLDTKSAPIRELKLVADIPETHIVITTKLQPATQLDTVTVGEPFVLKLTLTHTIRSQQTAENSIEITYDVVGQPDAWIIGGQRKAGFTTNDKGKFEAPIILIAQRPGHLLYPSIDIHCQSSTATSKSSANTNPVKFEVENLSAATSVLAIPNLQATTVGIGDGEVAEGHWLISSTRGLPQLI